VPVVKAFSSLVAARPRDEPHDPTAYEAHSNPTKPPIPVTSTVTTLPDGSHEARFALRPGLAGAGPRRMTRDARRRLPMGQRAERGLPNVWVALSHNPHLHRSEHAPDHPRHRADSVCQRCCADFGTNTDCSEVCLGDEQLATTHIYLQADMNQKERAIARVTPGRGCGPLPPARLASLPSSTALIVLHSPPTIRPPRRLHPRRRPPRINHDLGPIGCSVHGEVTTEPRPLGVQQPSPPLVSPNARTLHIARVPRVQRPLHIRRYCAPRPHRTRTDKHALAGRSGMGRGRFVQRTRRKNAVTSSTNSSGSSKAAK
jgi:hypothetical protein